MAYPMRIMVLNDGMEDTLSWLVDHVDDAPDVGDMIHAVAEHIKREKLV